MTFSQRIFSYLIPQVIEEVYSAINGKIVVKLISGNYRIDVEEYWQSGRYPAQILERALREATVKKNVPRNILILGLGGGSVVPQIKKIFSSASIVGVEIDPVMIYFGKKYFHLSTFSNLKIVIDEAGSFVKRKNLSHSFDIILSDLFIGCDVPLETSSRIYLRNIRTLLTDNGVYVCNLPYKDEYISSTNEFVGKIKKEFKFACTKHIPPHLIIWAYKRKSLPE